MNYGDWNIDISENRLHRTVFTSGRSLMNIVGDKDSEALRPTRVSAFSPPAGCICSNPDPTGDRTESDWKASVCDELSVNRAKRSQRNALPCGKKILSSQSHLSDSSHYTKDQELYNFKCILCSRVTPAAQPKVPRHRTCHLELLLTNTPRVWLWRAPDRLSITLFALGDLLISMGQ